MRNYAERNDCRLSRYGDFRSGIEGECYPDCHISSLPIIMCKSRLYTHAFFQTALVFCFVFLFSFNLQYEVAKHTSVTIKKKNIERERERAKGPGDVISKEVRT